MAGRSAAFSRILEEILQVDGDARTIEEVLAVFRRHEGVRATVSLAAWQRRQRLITIRAMRGNGVRGRDLTRAAAARWELHPATARRWVAQSLDRERADARG